MTREMQTVWRDKEGNRLMELKKPARYYIPLSEVSTETLVELRDAITDALTDATATTTPEAK